LVMLNFIRALSQ